MHLTQKADSICILCKFPNFECLWQQIFQSVFQTHYFKQTLDVYSNQILTSILASLFSPAYKKHFAVKKQYQISPLDRLYRISFLFLHTSKIGVTHIPTGHWKLGIVLILLLRWENLYLVATFYVYLCSLTFCKQYERWDNIFLLYLPRWLKNFRKCEGWWQNPIFTPCFHLCNVS